MSAHGHAESSGSSGGSGESLGSAIMKGFSPEGLMTDHDAVDKQATALAEGGLAIPNAIIESLGLTDAQKKAASGNAHHA